MGKGGEGKKQEIHDESRIWVLSGKEALELGSKFQKSCYSASFEVVPYMEEPFSHKINQTDDSL